MSDDGHRSRPEMARSISTGTRGEKDVTSQLQLPVLALSDKDADWQALSRSPRVKILAAGVDPEVTDAALRVFRDGGRLKLLQLESDQPQLPAAVTELTTLQRLHIVNPELSGLPHEIGRLDRLRTLTLETFQLGSLPRSIGKLSRLRGLYIDSHQLRRLPQELTDLGELRRFGIFFRGHFVSKKWGPQPYFRARFEQTLSEMLRLLAQLPRLSALTLGEPPVDWCSHDRIVREIPPDLCLLRSLETLRLIDCHTGVRLPIEVPDLARLRSLIVHRTWFVHSEAELRDALPHTRIEQWSERDAGQRWLRLGLDELPVAEALERARDILKKDSIDAALAEEAALAVGWLLHEDGQHRAAIEAADRCERSTTRVQNAVCARLLWADATLSADPPGPDAALAALDKLAPIRLNGLPDALVAWHWLISARAFRRLNQPDAEREAMQQASRSLGPVEPSASALLRRLRRWLGP